MIGQQHFPASRAFLHGATATARSWRIRGAAAGCEARPRSIMLRAG